MRPRSRLSGLCFLLVLGAMQPFTPKVSLAGVKEELEYLSRVDYLPRLRPGTRVEQISSYDRTGGNDDGFSGKYSFIRKEGDKLVLADLKGPGVIHRIWTPTPTDEIVEFYFDGEGEPRIRLPFSDLFSGKVAPFLSPVVNHEGGGFTCYVPIPYDKSCKVVYCGPRIQFHQILYRNLAAGETTVSFPREWNSAEREALESARKLWSKAGDPLVPSSMADVKFEKVTEHLELKPGESKAFFRAKRGGRIVGIELTPASTLEGAVKNFTIEAQWDNETVPAISVPAGDFFGFAFGKRSARSLLLGSRGDAAYCYLPMPYERSAKLTLRYERREGEDGASAASPFEIATYYSRAAKTNDEGRLYALWHRERPPEGAPYPILCADGRGHMIGAFLQAQGLNPGMTLFFEGDDVATIDGEMRLHGTGSEDAFNGGWYALADRWDEPFSLPLSGCLGYSIPLARTGGFRFYLGDKLSFEKQLHYTIEHGPEGNKFPVDYTSLAFYYADRPPAANSVPSAEARLIHQPGDLEYWLQLLKVLALAHGASLTYANTKDETAGKTWETMTLHPSGNQAFMKIELEVPGEGEYEVSATYLTGPQCGRFRAYQREVPIGEAIDAYAEKSRIEERHPLGTIRSLGTSTTLTFRIEGRNASAAGSDLVLHRIYLKRRTN